ncbi:MAG: TetR family transcriptional regulator [Rhodospirillales bacterium]|nr:TetR family transcriptional regulator [Rhodospirillales bacterium]
MEDDAFDTALIGAAFRLAGERGWSRVSVAAAAREAGLDLARARLRFPGQLAVLLKFARMVDRAALVTAQAEGGETGSVRDRLFELLMRRFDVLQEHRAGVEALLRTLPLRPGLALMLARATERSMGWMLEAAGTEATGPLGHVRAKALAGVWLWAVRAWARDSSEDLAATMAALDAALDRAEQAARMCGRWSARESEPAPVETGGSDDAPQPAEPAAPAPSAAAPAPPAAVNPPQEGSHDQEPESPT